MKPRTSVASTAAAVILLAVVFAGCGAQDSSSSQSAAQDAASRRYRAYLDENVSTLDHWVTAVSLKVKEDALEKAESRYAAARVPYGHIAVALDLEASPSENDFRRLEKAFFAEHRATGMGSVAQRLLADVERLQVAFRTTDLGAEELAEAISQTLAKILNRDLAGREERYSNIALVDVAASLEGVQAAFLVLKPKLAESDPALAAEIEAQFEKAYGKVGEWGILAREPEQARPREPGIAFVVYDELSPDSIRAIASPIRQLASLFSNAREDLE